MDIFTRDKVKILPNRKVIHEINRLPLVLEGDRNKYTGLWEIKLQKKKVSQQLNVLGNLDVNVKEKVTLL